MQDVAPIGREHNIFFRCVEDSNDAIMITDRQGVLVYVNRAWERIYEYTSQDAIGNSPRLLRSKYQAQEFYLEMWRQILDPKIGFWKGELINKAKSGKEVPIFLTITPYRDALGSVQGYMGIALDMTHKKALEAQLIRQDRLASIGLLSSGLAHEVGTPLGVIRGRAEYLMLLAGENEKIKSGLEVIVQQIDRISKLIYSLLHLARVEKSETARPTIVLHSFQQVANLLEQKLQRGSIQIDLQLSDLIRVRAESDKLTQVALNLVMNAIHAIEARTKREPDGPKCIRIVADEREHEWEISVSDTGTGITPSALDHLFKPFFTTKEVGEGTGLGLAISQQICQSWGGSLSADNNPKEQGAVFKILLPKI
jgi:PAS domain S-box-containing protein